jgi:spore germination cell wall hydrolase CwlJ-like protein
MTARERQKRRRRLRRRRQAIALATLSAVLVLVVAIRAGHERTEDKPEQTSQTVSTVETASPTYINALPAVSEKISITPPLAPEPVSRYADLEISEDDRYTLACLVYHEARGEPFEGQVAVIEVVLNRMLSPLFPDTVEEVVFQKYGDVWQFSPAPYLWTAEPSETQYEAVETAIYSTENVLPVETVFFSGTPYNDNIVAIIGGHYFCAIEEDK